jgi:hypothetical protein
VDFSKNHSNQNPQGADSPSREEAGSLHMIKKKIPFLLSGLVAVYRSFKFIYSSLTYTFIQTYDHIHRGPLETPHHWVNIVFHGVPGRDLNPAGLPYSRPAHGQLSYAASYLNYDAPFQSYAVPYLSYANPVWTTLRPTLSELRRTWTGEPYSHTLSNVWLAAPLRRDVNSSYTRNSEQQQVDSSRDNISMTAERRRRESCNSKDTSNSSRDAGQK